MINILSIMANNVNSTMRMTIITGYTQLNDKHIVVTASNSAYRYSIGKMSSLKNLIYVDFSFLCLWDCLNNRIWHWISSCLQKYRQTSINGVMMLKPRVMMMIMPTC